MKTALKIYSSGCDQNLTGFIATMGQNLGREVQLLPLSQMPRPQAQRRESLRVERAELRADLTRCEWSLEQYRAGQWQPDASHQNGLEFDRQALRQRIQGIDAVLGTEEGGPRNG